MTTELTITAWKDPVFRASLSTEELAQLPPHPAGTLARELTDTELAKSMGGHTCGCGWVCTVTGDCGCINGVTVCNWYPCTHSTHLGC